MPLMQFQPKIRAINFTQAQTNKDNNEDIKKAKENFGNNHVHNILRLFDG